tara:strand:- start:157 stop:675 length:519 start_codon:yes stop_codon:yes gene_type:complete
MTKKLPDHFWDYRKETKGQYPDLDKADAEHNVVRDKLSEVKNNVENLTQYSNTHDAALGILNEIKTDFECGSTLGKKEKKFALKYLGMYCADETLYEHIAESLEVLRQAKRNDFRKIIELEDQIPKLEKEEERLRKIWRMESDKVEAIYDDLKEKEKLAELEAEETEEEEAE